MKIICCKCKKEYSLERNIFKYDEIGQPILICPHCGFKHIINFMPFEKELKAKRIKKLNLGATYFVTLEASRIANKWGHDQSGGNDVDVTDWIKADNFILAIFVGCAKGPLARAYKLKWKVSGGTFADVGATGVINYDADTILQNDSVALNGFFTAAPDWDGIHEKASEGDNLLPSTGTINILDDYAGEFHWALNCDGAADSTTYEFELWDITEGASIGTCLAKLTMKTPVTLIVKTEPITDMATGLTTATGNGQISDRGSINATKRGICWNTTGSPTIADNKLEDDGSFGVCNFNKQMTGLIAGQTYYVKAYAYSATYGYIYGSEVNFFVPQIDVGAAPIVRANRRAPGSTYISKDNPININGIITRVDIWAFDPLGTITVAIFYETLPNIFTVRDYQYVGSCAQGPNSKAVSLDVQAGDYIGIYYATGWIYAMPTGGGGIWLKDGKYTSGSDIEFTFVAGDVNSIFGIGPGEMAAYKDATGKASLTSSVIAILSRGKIEGATGKASITSSVISKLQRTIDRTAKAEITSSVIAILKSGVIKNATGKASITTLLSAILARGKIENATAKADLTTNMDAVLSRGKIENATGKADITTLMQAILSNYINATAKASIDTNIDVTLARGKIENATGLAIIISSIISTLSRGKIEAVTGKSSITSNFGSILSRGKIENVTGKASITSSIITVLSRGKIENTSGKAEIETLVIVILSSGGIKNATGKAEITTNIDSQIRIIRKATAKSSMTSLIDIALSRGKIENTTGKANINSSIIIILSRGRIESVTGKASITSGITAALSRGRIESVTGKAEINTIVTAILGRGKIENATGKAEIISNLTAILQKEAAINASGKASITTNIEAKINRIIARVGKASLETSYNAILSRGKIVDVNGKAFIYTSIDTVLSRTKRATGKASINSFVNISLKRLINASGKSIFDTLIEIEITREYAFSQATLGIIRNQTELLIQETDTEIDIKRTETKLGIKR